MCHFNTSFLCPVSGDFDHKFCLNLRFCYPQKGTFYCQIWNIFHSRPRGTKIWPNKCQKNSNVTTIPIPFSLSFQTIISAVTLTDDWLESSYCKYPKGFKIQWNFDITNLHKNEVPGIELRYIFIYRSSLKSKRNVVIANPFCQSFC